MLADSEVEFFRSVLEFRKPFEKLLASAEAKLRVHLEEGGTVEGYRLAERRGARQWENENAVIERLLEMDFEEDYQEHKLKSPYQLEKLGFKAPDLIVQKISVVVVPENSNLRPAASGTEFENE